jgi:hypothetical protein
MTFRRRRVAALWLAAVVGLGVRDGAAEIRISPAAMEPAAGAQAAPAPAPRGDRVRRGAVRGALIGAGAGAVVTILAAVAYGRNEGGGICGACAWQWGALGIGAGAGIGAGVGALIGSATPSRQPGLWPPPGRRRGIAFAVRF